MKTNTSSLRHQRLDWIISKPSTINLLNEWFWATHGNEQYIFFTYSQVNNFDILPYAQVLQVNKEYKNIRA